MKIQIKHHLDDDQLEEVLEKALSGLRQKAEREADFEDPYMAGLFMIAKKNVDALMAQMSEKITSVLKFSP